MNSCSLQITNLIQMKYNSKGNLDSRNLPWDNHSHLESASFMILCPCNFPILIWNSSPLLRQAKLDTSFFLASLLFQVPLVKSNAIGAVAFLGITTWLQLSKGKNTQFIYPTIKLKYWFDFVFPNITFFLFTKSTTALVWILQRRIINR